MNRIAFVLAGIALSALASGCGRPQGFVEIRMPDGCAPSLAAVRVGPADGRGRMATESNVSAVVSLAVRPGASRVVFAFANSNYQPPAEVEAARLDVSPGSTNVLACGALQFEVDEKLPDLNLAGLLVQRTAGGAPFSLELKDYGNTYYFFKPKPLPAGIYEVAIRYSRSEAPSTVATGVVVAAGATAVVKLDSGFALKPPAGPRVEGWRLTREGESAPWLEVTRRTDNDEPLWRRVLAPPGTYTLVVRRAAPAGASKPETLVVASGQFLTHEPAAP